MCTLIVSNVIYHKFSHGAAFYTLNGKNVNVMLELFLTKQGYCDVYKWTILKRTSPEVKCLHPTSSRREMCTLSVSDVIYHKFSHGAAFYTLNRKNANVMLELFLTKPSL